MPNISSTLTASQDYTLYKEVIKGEKRGVKTIRIEGGANTASKHFITLEGVVTQVSNEDVEILLQIPAFKDHLDRGFVKIHREAKVNVKNLEKEDKSAPITPKTAKKKGLAKPMKNQG